LQAAQNILTEHTGLGGHMFENPVVKFL